MRSSSEKNKRLNLVVEIGNTALKAAWTEGTTLGKTFRYQGERKMAFISSIVEKEKPQVMVVASVYDVPPSDEKALKKMCRHLLILDSAHSSQLTELDIPEHLTYDRAASLIAARHLFKGKPCTVFDFGTTLTVDFLDSEGKYVGGNISLGCRTRFKALNRYSKALPLVNTPSDIIFPGNSVQTSIESGVISGIMFEIQGYIDQNPENIIVFTGGDAIYFVKKMKNSIFAVCNLVLMGLAQITDEYVRKND